LKLIQQLRQNNANSVLSQGETKGRTLKEIELKEPIRYASNDPIEKW